MNFKINGLTWKLLDVPGNHDKLQGKFGPCFGLTSFHELKIYMKEDQPRQLYRQTLIHEMIHAFTFSYGVHLFANENTEEPICDFMGAHMDAIMKIVNRVFDSRWKERRK